MNQPGQPPVEPTAAIGAAAALAAPSANHARAADFGNPSNAMGIVTYALAIHQKNTWAGRHHGLPPALAMLEECHRLGAGGIQVELVAADAVGVDELHRRADHYGMYVEAIIAPPRSEEDLDRFDRDVQLAQAAGASVARTVILPGRRYEQFASLDEYRRAEQLGLESLRRAVPVLARRKFRLAVENHKDQRIAEKLATLRHVGSEYVGICVDVGNNFPIMEDPLEAVRAFAPFASTVHIKDQAVLPYEEGYLLADVRLGDGFLDLQEMVAVLRQANPRIRFNFETITRDAIRVPVLTSGYWATLADTPARELARTWQVVRSRHAPAPFPIVSQLPVPAQLALEQENIQVSIAYARNRLGL
jgi:3-oxoisoapionate decarboxylase